VTGKRVIPSLEFQFIFDNVKISLERASMSAALADPICSGAGICAPGNSSHQGI
jgi:hypothetical protein